MNKTITTGSRLSVIFMCASFAHNAYPIGLGNITVTSKLNEPFRARIEIIESNAIPLRDLRINHAAKNEYQRAGLVYSNDLGFLVYKIKGPVEKPYISITSKENVTEPFINILLKLQWPKGDVFRGYSVLLDPPDYQLKRVTATHSMTRVSKRDRSISKRDRRVAKRDRAQGVPQSHPVIATRAAAIEHSHVIITQDSDTLWHIARSIQKDREDLSVYQIMVSVYNANKNDFINRDINMLRRHSKLEIPTYRSMARLSRQDAFYAFNDEVAEGNEQRQQLNPQVEAPVVQTVTTRVKPTESNTQPAQAEAVEIKQVEPAPKAAPKVEAPKPATVQQKAAPVKPKPAPVQVQPIEPAQPTQVQPSAQPKASSQPKLQMDEADPEDESNLWFLDTFNFEEEKAGSKAKSKAKPQSKPQAQVAPKPQVQQMAQTAVQPRVAPTPTAPEPKKKAEASQVSNVELAEMIAEQNKKFAEHARELKRLSAQVNKLTKVKQHKPVQMVQATALDDTDDNFWEIFWFVTTLIGLSSSVYLAYRLYLLSKIDNAGSAKADISSMSLAQDAIAMSKRKIQSAKDSVEETIDKLSERVGQVKATTEQAASTPQVQPQPKSEMQAQPKSEEQARPKPEVQPQPKPEVQPQPKPQVQPQPKPEVQAQPEPNVSAPVKPIVSDEPVVEEIVLDEEPTSTQIVEEVPASDDIATTETSSDDNSIEFDSSFSGQYQIGRKGERDEGAVSTVDMPADDLAAVEPGQYEIGRKGERQDDSVTADIDLPQDVDVQADPAEDIKEEASSATIGTKIDLATAYITMDDKVNARAILNEILEEGNNFEKEIAQKLLSELDKN
jgi:pilus assembly protein FimV